MQYGTICPLNEVPSGYAFSHVWDGRVADGSYLYAPHSLYVRTASGGVQDVGEFGRPWKLSDCGLTETTPVRVTSRLY